MIFFLLVGVLGKTLSISKKSSTCTFSPSSWARIAAVWRVRFLGLVKIKRMVLAAGWC